ncbi:zeta toxin family protein [Chryseobacterium lathyri]|uniref:Zeta toxin domain-containing protein n=1 Tax=Chryseobacterium lathyri TaxID=395933 RepID=A0ABT9SIM1_9FLAO|nr:zeta toxin family protein [Chryseobacterium lathyri]MDP9959288.1 hypothetical protein [Chryseobacterium lathyri]
MKKTSRQLNNFELVEHFLENALGYDIYDDQKYEIVGDIVSTELNIENFDESLISLNSKSYRVEKYRKDGARRKLQNQIVNELFSNIRLEKDEDICLGKGGAFPNTGIEMNKNAYVVIGLPASGKSGICSEIADKLNAVILDSDYAKRKLPEFNKIPFGASLVHEESDRIIFGDKDFSDSLFDYCVKLGANIVIPRIGSNVNSILNIIELLENVEYKIHLTLVELDRVKATQRALQRFKDTKRYVPLGLIFDTYSNNPSLSFYRIITFHKDSLESYGIINNDVERGSPPKCELKNSDLNPSKIYDNE